MSIFAPSIILKFPQMSVRNIHKIYITERCASFGAFVACVLMGVVLYILTSCVERSSTVAEGVFEKRGQGTDQPLDYDLEDIQQGGELIALTLYGPASYFEWRGEDFGPQYRLADAFGQSIGVSVRVEVCRSQQELFKRLAQGDGDLVAWQVSMDDSVPDRLTFCGASPITHLLDTLAVVERDRSLRPSGPVAWLVRRSSPQLAAALDAWLQANEPRFLALSLPSVGSDRRSAHRRRGHSVPIQPRSHPASPVLNAAAGQISHYDTYIKRYAREVGWDWRLLAAQAYQESGFDPQAVSWMGAQGLMQLMPSTARTFGVSASEVFDPGQNLRGAAAFIKSLQKRYASIPADERINFILAAYNAGPGHVDDARRLAEKQGRNPDIWNGHVADVVLRMSDATYYNDPVCRHGYFRGTETYNYVADIRERWADYRSKL